MRKTTSNRTNLKFESLENREMMAADISLTHGTLEVGGTQNDDVITFQEVSPYRTIDEIRGNSRQPVPKIRVTIADTSGNLLEEALFNRTLVKKIEAYGKAGADIIRNNTSIPSYLAGGTGNDYLYGGSVADTLMGQSGNDRLTGNSGNDTLFGSSGNDYLYGSVGNDALYGSSGDDVLSGNTGNDKLYGSSGKDLIHGGDGNDLVMGGSGNDFLYGYQGKDVLKGESGNDYLSGGSHADNLYGGSGRDAMTGGSGDDGLFGGRGKDSLRGDTGDDRFLIFNDCPSTTGTDLVLDLKTSDAKVEFENGAGRVIRASGGRWSEFDDGEFTDNEIEKVDQALADLHHQTGNTSLLKTAKGKTLVFERMGTWIDGNVVAAGVNGKGMISLVDDTFNSGTAWTNQIIFHEIGHNWDNENDNWKDWKDISDWKTRSGTRETRDGYTQSLDGNWWHDDSATFSRAYGMTSPKEDFATYFAKVMMDDSGQIFQGGNGFDATKERFMDDFFSDLR